MTDEDRPVHVEFNIERGENAYTPVTDEEWQAMKDRETTAIADEKRRADEDEQLRQAVQSHPDPVVQTLAKRAGII